MSADKSNELVERYIAAMRRKGATDPRCHVCGSAAIPAVEQRPVMLRAMDPDLEGVQTDRFEGIPSLVVMCRNCGFVRLHAADLLFPAGDDD